MVNRQLIWSISCIIMFAATAFINSLSTRLGTLTDQQTLNDKYNLPISPPPWTFSIWGLIYFWQAAWLLYITYHSIRYREELTSKNILTFGITFYISWIASCIFNGSWILLFASELLVLSAIVLVCISIALYINAYVNHKYIGLAAEYNPDNDVSTVQAYQYQFPSYLLNKTTITLYRILINNGIAFYGTWTSIAQCLNIGLCLTYVGDVGKDASSIIALSVLTVSLVIYWFLDFYYLRKWLVYTYGPYAVLLWALSAISTNPSEGDRALKGAVRNYVYVLIAMTAVATVYKIISGIIYACRDKDESTRTSHVNQYSGVETEYNAMEEL